MQVILSLDAVASDRLALEVATEAEESVGPGIALTATLEDEVEQSDGVEQEEADEESVRHPDLRRRLARVSPAAQGDLDEAEDDQGDAEEDVSDISKRSLGAIGLEQRMGQTAEGGLDRSEDEDDQAEASVRLVEAATVSQARGRTD